MAHTQSFYPKSEGGVSTPSLPRLITDCEQSEGSENSPVSKFQHHIPFFFIFFPIFGGTEKMRNEEGE